MYAAHLNTSDMEAYFALPVSLMNFKTPTEPQVLLSQMAKRIQQT